MILSSQISNKTRNLLAPNKTFSIILKNFRKNKKFNLSSNKKWKNLKRNLLREKNK